MYAGFCKSISEIEQSITILSLKTLQRVFYAPLRRRYYFAHVGHVVKGQGH